MDDSRLRHWLALSRLRLDRVPVGAVIERFGAPEEVFAAPRAQLASFSTVVAEAVAGFCAWAEVDAEMKAIADKAVRVLTFEDVLYPALLKLIPDPPPVIYVKGRVEALASAPAVAVVGTRRPTHYGLQMAEEVSRDLARSGVAVVSGMARGCDTSAHMGALSGGGMTVAVLGTGIDIPYPKENARLYEEIADRGALVSELPLSTPPFPQNFPRRNRIISGLSLGVLVVEAPLRSGSLMTARLALDYGRDVLAVPGKATSARSAGPNRLIKDGAALVECADDVLSALGLERTRIEAEEASLNRLDGEESIVSRALGDEPVHIDEIALRTGLSASRISGLLLSMELKGLVGQLTGKRFVRRLSPSGA